MKFKTQQILSEKLSLLFGNFETIEMGWLDQRKSENLIKQIASPITLEKSNIDFITNFAAGHQFYINLIVSTLKDYLKIQSLEQAQSECLIKVLGSLLFDKWGQLNLRFRSLLDNITDCDKNSYDFVSLLLGLAEGNAKIKDLVHIIHEPQKIISSKLGKLVEKDVLIKNGNFYKITDPLFSFWLKFVYLEKLKALDFKRDIQIKLFEEKIRQAITEFAVNSQKTIPERLTELFSLFNDDSIQIEKSKIRLSRFKEIKPLSQQSKNWDISMIARSSDSLWIIAIKTNNAAEEKDITDFSSECKKYKSRIMHKIFVSAADIDTNTRLLAKEEKILTWNIGNLNSIMDFYNKPRLLL